MANRVELMLHEELLLLALRDKEGTIAPGSMHEHAMAGAILAELLLRTRIRLDPVKGKRVEVVDPGHLGNPLVDECLVEVRDAKRRKTLNAWVTRFASIRKLTQRVAEGLCEQGILRADEDKILLIFNRKIYPEINPAPEREMIERLREAIFTESTDIDPRTAVLASLANSADLLAQAFDKKALRQRKKRLGQIAAGEVVGKAVQESINAMQAALMAAVIIPAVVVTPCS